MWILAVKGDNLGLARDSDEEFVLVVAAEEGMVAAAVVATGLCLLGAAVVAAAEGEVLVVATRSQEGHMVRVVAGSCM